MHHSEPDIPLDPPRTIKYSLIIVTHNDMSYLRRCCAALSREINLDCEVIVVDNASSEAIPDFFQQNYPGFNLIRNTENTGFAAACNQATRVAKGGIFVFLNPDTEVCPGWLLHLTRGLEQASGPALINSKINLLTDPQKILSAGLNVHFTGLTFARHFFHDQEKVVTTEPVPAISGTSFAVRREIWEELGGFDERFFIYFEDVDLSWRAQLAGYRCLLRPDSVVRHRHPARPSDFSLYYSARNRLFMLVKNYRWTTLLLLLPALLVVEMIDWVYYLSFGFRAFLAKLRSYGWLVSHIPVLVAAHRENQNVRRVKDWEILGQRVSSLRPSEVTGDAPGRIVTGAANWILHRYYVLVVGACRGLGI